MEMRDRIDREFRARRELLGEAFQEIRQGLDEGWDDSRVRARELAREVREWWRSPLPMDERVDDVRRLARRGREGTAKQLRRLGTQAEGYLRLSVSSARVHALRNDYSMRQGYASFLLTSQEVAADQVLVLLTPRQRATLVPLAEQMRDAQIRMAERVRSYRDCAECVRTVSSLQGGDCCAVWVAMMFRPVDGVFRRLLDERAPQWPRFAKDFSRCGFMGPRGCILPLGTRPVVCTGYFCDSFREHLDADGTWAELRPEFRQLRRAIKELEFRFNLHRRFLVGTEQTITDGTVGYLWDKLLKVYAAYDEIAPPRTAGVDVLVEEEAKEETAASSEELAAIALGAVAGEDRDGR